MSDYFEQRRAASLGVYGVFYDRAQDKFVGEIYHGGKRKRLGRFDEVTDASQAVAEAKLALSDPSLRVAKPGSFARVYAAFMAEHEGEDHGNPPAGAVMKYDGQEYIFREVSFRGKAGAKFPYGLWESDCRKCGDYFETLVPLSIKAAKGITRNCPEHVKAHPFAIKAVNSEERVASPQPVETIGLRGESFKEAFQTFIEGLALVSDTMPLEEAGKAFLVAFGGRYPDWGLLQAIDTIKGQASGGLFTLKEGMLQLVL